MEPDADADVEASLSDPPEGAGVDGQLSLSYSQIETFQQCPHRWWLVKRAGVRRAPSEALIMGQAVHFAIEADLRARMTGEPRADMAELKHHLHAGLAQQLELDDPDVLIGPERRTLLEREGQAVLEAYVREVSPRVQPVEVEREFRFVHPSDPSVAFAGRIDAITQPEHGTRERTIVDWKVTRRPWRSGEEDRRMQAPAYLWAERCMGWERSTRVTFITFPPKPLSLGRVAEWRPTRPSERRIRDYAELVCVTAKRIRDMEARDRFPPRESALCGWCDVRGACEAGRQYVSRNRIVESVPCFGVEAPASKLMRAE